jgi:hypothetical protein
MEQPNRYSFESRRTRFSLAAGLVVAPFITATVRFAGAQADSTPTRVTIKRSSLSVRNDSLAEGRGFEPAVPSA